MLRVAVVLCVGICVAASIEIRFSDAQRRLNNNISRHRRIINDIKKKVRLEHVHWKERAIEVIRSRVLDVDKANQEVLRRLDGSAEVISQAKSIDVSECTKLADVAKSLKLTVSENVAMCSNFTMESAAKSTRIIDNFGNDVIRPLDWLSKEVALCNGSNVHDSTSLSKANNCVERIMYAANSVERVGLSAMGNNIRREIQFWKNSTPSPGYCSDRIEINTALEEHLNSVKNLETCIRQSSNSATPHSKVISPSKSFVASKCARFAEAARSLELIVSEYMRTCFNVTTEVVKESAEILNDFGNDVIGQLDGLAEEKAPYGSKVTDSSHLCRVTKCVNRTVDEENPIEKVDVPGVVRNILRPVKFRKSSTPPPDYCRNRTNINAVLEEYSNVVEKRDNCNEDEIDDGIVGLLLRKRL